MSTAVIITAITCVSIVVMYAMTMAADTLQARLWTRRERLGTYQRFLAAVAAVASDDRNVRSWRSLAAAMNAIGLSAPPQVVAAANRCCRELRRQSRPLPEAAMRELLLVLRQDLGVATRADTDELDFDVVTAEPRGAPPDKEATGAA
jgi:hypothetical protein